MLSAAIILAIAIAIYLGYKTSLNTGLFCIVFAYLIGCLFMGLKPKAVIGFWPVSTMFVILSVSLFYNVAAINGTLEKMSGSLLYSCRKFPGMLPMHYLVEYGIPEEQVYYMTKTIPYRLLDIPDEPVGACKA